MKLSSLRSATGLLGLVLAAAAIASAGSPLSNDPSPLAVCQDTIRVAAINLASDVRRGVGACLTRGIECVAGPAEPGVAECCARAADRCESDLRKVERARRRFETQIVRRRCSAVPFADVLHDLGYEQLAERCAALEPAETIETLDSLVACLDRLALAETACLIGTTELPRAADGLACLGIAERFASVVGTELEVCAAPVRPSPSASGTPVPTSSAVVATATATPVRSATSSPSPAASPTSSPEATATRTATPSPTVTATVTTSAVATVSPVATTTATGTPLVTGTASATPTPIRTATSTAAATLTATVTPIPTTTPVATATTTAAATATTNPTASGTPQPTVTATVSATRTTTPVATVIPTTTATRTATPVASVTPTTTATRTATPVATAIPTTTATRTATPVATAIPTTTATRTAMPVATVTATRTATPVATVTTTRTATPVPTASATPSGPVCGNGAKEAGEDCDDGNTLDCDTCPSNCRTAPADCAAGATRAPQTVRLLPPAGQSLTSSVICLRYPAGTVGLPGTGLVTMRASGFAGTVSVNDFNNAVTIGMLGRNVLSEINVTLSFDLCNGATAPPPTTFACRVVSASNAGASVDPKTVECSPVAVP